MCVDLNVANKILPDYCLPECAKEEDAALYKVELVFRNTTKETISLKIGERVPGDRLGVLWSNPSDQLICLNPGENKSIPFFLKKIEGAEQQRRPFRIEAIKQEDTRGHGSAFSVNPEKYKKFVFELCSGVELRERMFSDDYYKSIIKAVKINNEGNKIPSFLED